MTKRPSQLSSKLASKMTGGVKAGENAAKPLKKFNELAKSILSVSNKTVKDLEAKERLQNNSREGSAEGRRRMAAKARVK